MSKKTTKESTSSAPAMTYNSPSSQLVAVVAGPGAALARDTLTMNGGLYPGASSVWESMLPFLSKDLSPAGQYNVVDAETTHQLSRGSRAVVVGPEGGGINDDTTEGGGGSPSHRASTTSKKNSNKKGKKVPLIPAPPVCRPEAPIADEIEMMMIRDRVMRGPKPPPPTHNIPSSSNNRSSIAQQQRVMNGSSTLVDVAKTDDDDGGDDVFNRSLSPGYSDVTAGGDVGNGGGKRSAPPRASFQKRTVGGGGDPSNKGGTTNNSNAAIIPSTSTTLMEEGGGGFSPEGMFKGDAMTQGIFVVNTSTMDNVQRTGIPLPGAASTNSKVLKNPTLAVTQPPATNPKKRKGPSTKKTKKGGGEVVGFAGVALPTAPAPPSDVPVVFPHPVVVGNVSYVQSKYTAPPQQSGGNGNGGASSKSGGGGGATSSSSSGPSPARGSGGNGGGDLGGDALPFRTWPVAVTSAEMESSVGGGSNVDPPTVLAPASSYFYGYSRPHAIPSGPHTASQPVPVPVASTTANGGGAPSSPGRLLSSRGGGGGGTMLMTIPGVMTHMKDPTQVMLISESSCQQRTELLQRLRGPPPTPPSDTSHLSSPHRSQMNSREGGGVGPSSSSLRGGVTAGSTLPSSQQQGTPPPPTSDRLQPRPPIRDQEATPFPTNASSSSVAITYPGRNTQWAAATSALSSTNTAMANNKPGDELVEESTRKLRDLKGYLIASEGAALEAPRAIDRYNVAMQQYEETQRVLKEAVQGHHDEAALLLYERARMDGERAVLISRISLLRGTLRLMDVDHGRRHEQQRLDHGIELDRLREELDIFEAESEQVQKHLKDKRETLAATAEADTSLIRLTRQYEVDEKRLTSQLTEERERLAQTMSGKLKRTFTEMAALASRQQGDREVRAAQEASRLAEELREIEKSSGDLNNRMGTLKTTLASCDRNISLERQRYEMLRAKNVRLSKQVGASVDELRALEGQLLPGATTTSQAPTVSIPGPLPPPSPRRNMGGKGGGGILNGSSSSSHNSFTNKNLPSTMRSPRGGGYNTQSLIRSAPTNSMPLDSMYPTLATTTNAAVIEARELAREVDDERRAVRGLHEHNAVVTKQIEARQLELRRAKAALVQRVSYADSPITNSDVLAALRGLDALAAAKAEEGDRHRLDEEEPSFSSEQEDSTRGDPDLESAAVQTRTMFPSDNDENNSNRNSGTFNSVTASSTTDSNIYRKLKDKESNDRYVRALLPIAAIAQAAVEELSLQYIEASNMQLQLQRGKQQQQQGGGGHKGILTSSQRGDAFDESPANLRTGPTGGSVSMLSIASASGTGPWTPRRQASSGVRIPGGGSKTSGRVGSVAESNASTTTKTSNKGLSFSDNGRGSTGGGGATLATTTRSNDAMFLLPPHSGEGGNSTPSGGGALGREISMLCEHADPHEKQLIQDFVVSRINKRLSAFYPSPSSSSILLGGAGSRTTLKKPSGGEEMEVLGGGDDNYIKDGNESVATVVPPPPSTTIPATPPHASGDGEKMALV